MAASPPAFRRIPLVALGLAALVCGVWGGLLRLNWELPAPEANWITFHGALMVSGFLGTLISLERAVGLGRWWGFGAPLLTGAGGIALLLGDLSGTGLALQAAGSAVLVAVFVTILRKHPDLPVGVMTAGAVCWLAGNVFLALGGAVRDSVLWWMAFLVLTVAAERLELNRFLAPSRTVRLLFVAGAGAIAAGTALSLAFPAGGARLTGAGMAGLALWLLRHDIAWKSFRLAGLGRFIAWSLLPGTIWLGISGLLLLAISPFEAGPPSDAVLHTLFVGFALSMVFGHAPIIFPALLHVAIRFSRRFYLHLGLLHCSLLVRIAGDLAGSPEARMWGALLNGAAIAFFFLNTLISVRRAPRAREAR